MQLIPAIDLLDGSMVRLLKGDFERRTSYEPEPIAHATALRNSGAGALHVVDLNAARGDANTNHELVCKLAAVDGLRTQCGGGVRDAKSCAALLAAGAARVVVGSLSVRDPKRVLEWLTEFGADRIVLALDVKLNGGSDPEPVVHGWQQRSGLSLWSLLDRYAGAGLRHLLCTDIDRDGTLQGPNFNLYREILRRYPKLHLQASGGIGNIADLRALRNAGVPAVIVGRALLDGRVAMAEALRAAA